MFLNLKRPQLLLLLTLLNILCSCSHEGTNSVPKTTKSVSGTVVKIADGDTITILDSENVQHKIRLQGIDAPERKQDFSEVSREHLASLIFGKYVRVEYEKTDRFGRLVGKVWIDDNDECLEQLKAGLAWHYKEYEKEQQPVDRRLYASAEQEARTQKLGLWRDANPLPPWDFRHHTNGTYVESDSPEDKSSNSDSKPATATVGSDEDLTNGNLKTGHEVTRNVVSENNNTGVILGNKRTMIYHWSGCPYYNAIALSNRVPFKTREDAERAGYRAARNCN